MAIPVSVSGTINTPQGRHWFSIIVKDIGGNVEFETPSIEKVISDPAAMFSSGAPQVS